MATDKAQPTGATLFDVRTSVEQVEEGTALAPKFDDEGLIPCVTTDADTLLEPEPSMSLAQRREQRSRAEDRRNAHRR